MIIELRIKNYRSYKEPTSFTFEAVDEIFQEDNVSELTVEGESKRILNSAAILGANASGKSNIIRALDTFRTVVVYSRNFSIDMGIPGYSPFLDKDSYNKPVEMTLLLTESQKLYSYEISFTNSIFLKERLCEIIEEKEEEIFSLDFDEEKKVRRLHISDGWLEDGSSIKNIELLPNQLFLSFISTVPAKELNKIYSQIVSMSIVTTANIIDQKQNMDYVSSRILPNKKIFERLKRLLKIADVGINDADVIEHKPSEFSFPDNVSEDFKKYVISNNQWEYRFHHKIENPIKTFEWSNESTGTLNIFGLGARILDTLDKGTFLAYDEMNMSIHPEMFKLLISLFNNPKSNPNKAQLLFTTHDVSAIGDSTLRADQIWFAEKDSETGVSELYSVQDFDGAKINMPFEKWYRAGRFGALPKFGSIEYIFDDNAE